MQDKPIFISLIDIAPIHIALANPPGGGLWEIVQSKRQEETGRALFEAGVRSLPHHEFLRFVGPTITGLGDSQLNLERERLERIRQAAEEAIKAIDAHLAMRHAPLASPASQRAAWSEYIRREPDAIRIEFEHGGRYVVVVLEQRGDVIARNYGGAVYHMGQQVRWPEATVKAWRSQSRPDLHARILNALLEAGFPDVPLAMLYPDERPSSITLYHRNGASASIMAPGRFFRDKPALEKIEREINAICYATQTTPPTHTLPNPDR